MLSTISFFIGFCIGSLDGKIRGSLDQMLFVRMLMSYILGIF